MRYPGHQEASDKNNTMGGSPRGKHKDINHDDPRHPRHAQWLAARQQGQATHFQAPAMAAPAMAAPAMAAPAMQVNWQGQCPPPSANNQFQNFMANPNANMYMQQPAGNTIHHQGMMGMQYQNGNQGNNFNAGNTGAVF